ncbi:uncharacterized protein THITE_2111589 [Thermothielavioides terrestris NRRL 8126]|uniref:Uncharacterized protein n=1 Tax=Thermothielavioides terrestris (strain ATCC 38088 / NRRL 8126) TaxID=578455 RepID=G2R2T5_THETT|nr:uncharacterized protein THITE_2111589 [Thermothielavioides terrestris NRRL 8126]AEO65046.1 hypothetical protein THITE_2111589 [Thermothielavioides terrestris NRRL 8126]
MSTVPSIRPGNLPSPVGFGGNDSVASEDSLTSRITVKSLTNLASYSNPMQKAAQKALARARTANLGVHRAEASSQFLSPGSDVSKDRLPGTYRPTPGAAGPPQPLTAGPPGHRPYKPSSLEAASRIPHLDGQSVQAPLKTTTTTTTSGSQSRSPPMGLPYTIASSVLATIDDDDKVEGTIQPGPFRFDETNHGSLPYNQPELTGYRHPPTEIPSETTATSVEHAKPKIHDTLPPERIEKYYPRGFPHNYVGRHQPVKEDGYMSFPTMNGQLAQKACPEQVNRIHQNFYAGSKAFTKKLDSLVGDNNNRCLESKVGIIGEERERLRGSNIEKFGADGEIQSQFLSVEEANRMNGSDATRPLIELALATLLGYKEASKTGIYQWPCSFIKADDAWVDDSDEGNTSFFSKPKDELKKRRIVKKARRGY